MKKLLFIFLITSVSFAQNANRKYLSHSWKNNILEIKTTDGAYMIKPYSDKIVETSFIPTGETFNPISSAVVKVPEKTKSNVTKTNDDHKIYTKGITVVINKSPFRITYSSNGKVLLSEKTGYTKVNDRIRLGK
jgi:oligosaccharide 4-alpha-D-glucosyltransferase